VHKLQEQVWATHSSIYSVGRILNLEGCVWEHIPRFANDVMSSYILGVVYNMDHEAVPRPRKICDWLLNSSRDHFGLHQGKKNVIVTMKFEVPKIHVVRHALSIDMVQHVLRWERQKRCYGRKRHGLWQRNVVIIYF
jgi:hypothetical protein